MNDLFSTIKECNLHNGAKQVMSISTDAGEYRTYTYDSMFLAVDQFAKKLHAAGVRQGDRVALIAENSPEWNIAYLSVMQLGCTAVLIDFSLPAQDILRLLENADVRCVFTSPKVSGKLENLPVREIPVLNLLDDARPVAGYPAAVAPDLPSTPDGDSEVAFIIYSSGTTKTATGIMHTHEAMLGTTYAAIAFNHLKNDEKMLVVIPNSHIYGVVTSMLGPLLLGGSMHFIESMTAENVLKAFAEFQPTVFSCVPRVFEMFERQIVEKINHSAATATMFKLFFPLCVWLREKTGFNLGKLLFGSIHRGFGGHVRILCAAGAPMNPKTVKFYFGVGMNLYLNYGLTETNVPVIANSPENYTLASCGKPYPHVEIKLDQQEQGDFREVYMKTPFMMKGYFRDEAATAAAFEDGWFKTGDLATTDAQGNISIVGRCKDNIILATGKKVTPDDIEAGYASLSGVKEFVACGVPAVAGGYDEVHAFVVCEAGARETLEETVRKRGAELSQYMKISKLHIVEEIPKTSLQKPKRYLLRLQALAEKASVQPASEQPPVEVDRRQTVLQLVRQVSKTEQALLPNTRLLEDLGMDSLDCIELDALLEAALGRSVVRCLRPQVTVEDLMQALEAPIESDAKPLLHKVFPAEKRLLDYCCFKFYTLLTRLVYRVEFTGLDNLPQGGSYLICPNHQTNFDFLWVTMKFGRKQFQKLGCLAKQELFNCSLASRMLSRVCGMIPVDRDKLNAQAISLCREKIKEGWNFLIYPEGTRTRDGEMGEFKKGAAMLSLTEHVPIVPVRIKGGFEIFPSGHKLPKLFDFKNMHRYRVQVAFAKPIIPYDLDIDSLNQKLRDTVASM